MNDTTAEQGTALATLQAIRLPDPVKVGEEMRQTFGTMYTRIEESISALDPDMSQKKNREAARSLAYDIAKTKTALDNAAAGACDGAKKIIDAVNVERRTLREQLDKLRDTARAPLTKWEAEEKAREERQGEMMGRLLDLEQRANFGPSSRIRVEIADLMALEFDEALFGEYGVEALENRSMQTLEKLRYWAEHFEKAEAEAAELEQLRAEKAERERQEEERRLEEERIEQERIEEQRRQEEEQQRIENERAERERIAKEAEEKAAREAKEKIEAERREREAAEQRAKDAEERAERERLEAIEREKEAEERRQREAKEAEEAVAAAALKAEEDAKRREQEAAERERDRIAREKAEEEEAERARAADQAHRQKINQAVLAAIVAAADIPEDQGKALIAAIVRKQIPHVTLTY